MTDYDVIVLGGGSAGSSAAAAAQAAGARTLMINAGELGGLCVLRGCMPTKSILAAAHAVHAAEHLEPFGARLEGHVEIDFARIMERKDGHVARFKRAKIEAIHRQEYELLDARARFVAPGVVQAGDRRLTANRFVIATGSVPQMLSIDGLERVPVWTSDDVMLLKQPPRSLIVQGAGPIGLELAQFFARVGTEVTLINRSPLLSHSDVECGAELRAALDAEPRLRLLVPGTIQSVEPCDAGLRASVTSGSETVSVEADALLMAVGRRAVLDDLALDRVGLEIVDGRLPHDETMRTANETIFAAGDATGGYQILHLANQEGRIAGHNAAGGAQKSIDYRLQMAVIFTDPPFAEIGANDRCGSDPAREIVIGKARFPQTGRAITMETRHGLWKLFVDRQSGEILGSSILGPRADDLIHEIALLMHYHAKIGEIAELPWYHPTLSEVLLDLARDVEKQRT